MYSGFLNLKVGRDYLCPSFVVKNSVYKTFTAFTGNSFDIKAMLVVILSFQNKQGKKYSIFGS